MTENGRIKDEWTNEMLHAEKLLLFDSVLMGFKVINQLFPENLCNEFQHRSQDSCYNVILQRSIDSERWDLEYVKTGFSYLGLMALNEIPTNIKEVPTVHGSKKQLQIICLAEHSSKSLED